jgi:hypothetical protein
LWSWQLQAQEWVSQWRILPEIGSATEIDVSAAEMPSCGIAEYKDDEQGE